MTPAIAQQQKPPAMVAEDGGLQERGSARVLYWDTVADKALGQFAIDYGRPVWKAAYDDPAKFDAATKGKTYRLGSNWWTTLDTQVPLRVGGIDVAVGSYFLGLERSPDGASWSLVFIDPTKVRDLRLDAFQIERAPTLLKIPMTTEPPSSSNDKLTITLTYPKENPKKVKLTIAWGKLQVSAPVDVTVGP
jgi:hypothetical protein